MALQVRNWSQYQGYAKRGPSWVKLHVGLINDPAWINLPTESKALLPALWIVASGQGTDGWLPDDVAMLSILSHFPTSVVKAGLQPLVDAGFMVRDECVAAGATDVSGEKRREETEERREEREGDSRQKGTKTAAELAKLGAHPVVGPLGDEWAAAMDRPGREVGALRAIKQALDGGYHPEKISLVIRTMSQCRSSPERFKDRSGFRWAAENNCSPGWVLRTTTLDKLIPEAEAWWRD